MPKGPKQQPPEPEWIGDGETTSPTGKAGRQRRKKVEKRREKCALGPRRGWRARDSPGRSGGYCACVQWGRKEFALAGVLLGCRRKEKVSGCEARASVTPRKRRGRAYGGLPLVIHWLRIDLPIQEVRDRW